MTNCVNSRYYRAFLPAAVLALVLGCGYSTDRPFRDDVQTIHVEMLHSKEFRRELEFKLTEALVKRIEMDTPYRIAPRERADSVLSGEIIEVQENVFGTDFDTDLPREKGTTIVMNWRWKNLRTGELQDVPRQLYTTSYIPPVGEEFDTAMVRGLDGIAEQVVEAMEIEW
jgi:hypothetical protein